MSPTSALARLALAMTLAMTTWFSAVAVLPQLRAQWSLSSGDSAWLTIAVQLGFVAGALLSATLNLPDRIRPQLVVFGSAIGAAAANALVTAAPGPALAIALRFATGLFAAGIYPPLLKVMATHFREGRGLALGVLVGAITLGSALPHLVNGLGGADWRAGGVLGDRWGRTRTTALAMTISGTCAAIIGAVFASPGLVLALGLVWGIAVVADSAQFSTMVTELADQAYVGTALTLQLAVGFSLTVATIWLVPLARDHVGWSLTFALLVPGPALGVVAMLRLRRRPEAARIARGRG